MARKSCTFSHNKNRVQITSNFRRNSTSVFTDHKIFCTKLNNKKQHKSISYNGSSGLTIVIVSVEKERSSN